MNIYTNNIFLYAVLFISALTTLGCSVYVGGTKFNFFELIINLWILLPYIIVLFLSRHYFSVAKRVSFLIIALACVLATYFWVFDPLFIHKSSDAQGALVFLFLPLYQIMFTFLCFGISQVIDFIKK